MNYKLKYGWINLETGTYCSGPIEDPSEIGQRERHQSTIDTANKMRKDAYEQGLYEWNEADKEKRKELTNPIFTVGLIPNTQFQIKRDTDNKPVEPEYIPDVEYTPTLQTPSGEVVYITPEEAGDMENYMEFINQETFI